MKENKPAEDRHSSRQVSSFPGRRKVFLFPRPGVGEIGGTRSTSSPQRWRTRALFLTRSISSPCGTTPGPCASSPFGAMRRACCVRDHFDIVHGGGRVLRVNVLNPHGGVERAYLGQRVRVDQKPSLLRLQAHEAVPFDPPLPGGRTAGGALPKARPQEGHCNLVDDKKRYRALLRFPRGADRGGLQLRRHRPASIRTTEPLQGQEANGAGRRGRRPGLALCGKQLQAQRARYAHQGAAVPEKGFSRAGFHLLVVGRGHERPYRRLSRTFGVSACVSFLGSVTGMEHYYAASDIYVHPTFYDSCSLTVLEALASGLPVVTSRFNGACDAIVSEEGGRVIGNPADPRELASAVAFYVDEKRRDRARTVTRSWMEAYKPSRNVEETLAVYYESGSSRKPLGALPTPLAEEERLHGLG